MTLLVSFFFRWAFAGLKRAARWPGEANTARAMASTLHGRQVLIIRQRTKSLVKLCQHSGDSLFLIGVWSAQSATIVFELLDYFQSVSIDTL